LRLLLEKKSYAVPMQGFSLLVAKSLPRRLSFDPRPVNARSLVDNVTQSRITPEYA